MKLASPSSFTAFEKAIEAKIVEILERIKFLVEQKDVLSLKESVQNRPLRRLHATSLVDESSVYGRDGDKEFVVELLSSDVCEKKISMIPIVGMGGIGKTTLARLVYNDNRAKGHFELKAWVAVSDDIDVSRITRAILEAITNQTYCPKGLDQLQVRLADALRGKRFLLVLDDVWNKNYECWDALRTLQSGAHGSKIVVTTCNERIASMMGDFPTYHLKPISHEDCWRLFARHALDIATSSAHANLEIRGKEIVKKCKGVPLAVKSLAGLLRGEPNIKEWEKILKSEMWELPNEGNGILPALWLSYYHLPSHLKRCFSYCSIFPKDYEFSKEELVIFFGWQKIFCLPRRGKRWNKLEMSASKS